MALSAKAAGVRRVLLEADLPVRLLALYMRLIVLCMRAARGTPAGAPLPCLSAAELHASRNCSAC